MRQEKASCENRIAACNAEKEALGQRLEQIASNEKEIAERLNKSAGQEGNLVEKYNKSQEEVKKLLQTAQELKQKIKQEEFRQFDVNKDLQRRQQAYSGEKGSIAMLKDVADNYKRYQDRKSVV